MEDRSTQPMAVHVVGVKIPFLELVVLLVKFSLALIPALFILTAASWLFACAGSSRSDEHAGGWSHVAHRLAVPQDIRQGANQA